MQEGYKYRMQNTHNQIAKNDNGNWYRRGTGLNKDYMPWSKCSPPIFKNGKLRVNNFCYVNVEPLTTEPDNLPKD